MYLFKRKTIFKTLCLVLLSSLTLNIYSFNPGNSQDKKTAKQVITQNPLLEKIEKNILGQVAFGQDSIITDNEWKELEVDKIVGNWKKHTKSNFDSWGTKYLLKNAPEGSKEMLKALVENEQAYKIVDEIIEKVKAAEESLVHYYNKEEIIQKNNFEKFTASFLGGVFFGLTKGLDKIASSNTFSTRTNVKIYSISSICKTIIAPAYSIFSFLGGTDSMIDLFKAFKNGDQSFSLKNSFIDNFKQIIRDFNPIPGVFKPGYIDTQKEMHMRYRDNGIDSDYKKLTLGDQLISNNAYFNLLLKNASQNKRKHTITVGKNKSINCLSWLIGAGAALIGQSIIYMVPILSIKTAFTNRNNHRQECKEMQKNLSKIADMLKSLEQLKSDDLLKNTFFARGINNLLDQARKSTKLKELFCLLDSPSFIKDTSNYSVGEAIAANNLLKEITAKKESEDFSILSKILKSISCLGGYRAIATMMKESKISNSNAKYCFVEKIDSPTPVIDLKNAWSPLLDSTKAIPNDINLGNNSAQNAILTGPNGGGKSIMMMTTGFNVLLSNLGIAAAESARITSFAKIITSTSNQPEQEADKDSRFETELIRMDRIENTLKTCKGKILVLLDEPYSGTAEVAGGEEIYNLCKKTALLKTNCSMMIATHTSKPSTLADNLETHNLFKNYHMSIIEKKDNIFEKEFKINDGPANWWFNDTDKKRTRYIYWLKIMARQKVIDKKTMLYLIEKKL